MYDQYYVNRWSYDQKLHEALKTIKFNDGFLGPVDAVLRQKLLRSGWVALEVSPVTGLDFCWLLTPEGKKQISYYNGMERRAEAYRKKYPNGHPRSYRNDAPQEPVVPLTVEVLDALKSIRLTGEPGTTRLDILARIQRYGKHGATHVNGVWVHGALAECKDGVWKLTTAGKAAEAGHIRKSECAQFSGKVR